MKINYAKLFNQINETLLNYAPGLSSGDRQETHDFIEALHKDETILVNGYKIVYNCLFKQWQTSHPEIGMTEQFSMLWDAIQYCNKG